MTRVVQIRPCGVCGLPYRTTLPHDYFIVHPAADRCARCEGQGVPAPGRIPPPPMKRAKTCCGAMNGHRAGCRVIMGA